MTNKSCELGEIPPRCHPILSLSFQVCRCCKSLRKGLLLKLFPGCSAVFPGGSEDAGCLLGGGRWAAEGRFWPADFPAPARGSAGRQQPPGERLSVRPALRIALDFVARFTLHNTHFQIRVQRQGSKYFSLSLFSASDLPSCWNTSSAVHMRPLAVCCTYDKIRWAFVVPQRGNLLHMLEIASHYAWCVLLWRAATSPCYPGAAACGWRRLLLFL